MFRNLKEERMVFKMARKKLVWLCSIIGFVLILNGLAAAQQEPQDQAKDDPILVGRISHVEGDLSRYVPEKQEWVTTAQDAPFGLNDSLYSFENGRAELIMPNNTWARIAGSTQIELLVLKPDLTELDVATGTARFFNKGTDTELKVTTPFGYVLAPTETTFDLYVGPTSMEVIAIKGTVDFVHATGDMRYEVVAGSTSIIADSRQVITGEGQIEVAWDEWNAARDSIWSQRLLVKGESVKYLPTALHGDSYAFEEHGRWERVQYEGEFRHLWRPVGVSASWRPFTAGRWVEWHGDHCWIPAEPFGYVTHHYGNWVMVNSAWYWAPPVVSASVNVGIAHAGVSFNWYPGRVAWLHRHDHIGWVTLAPNEVYYSHRYWGPGSVVIAGVSASLPTLHVSNYRYINHAVVVRQSSFYSVRSYHRSIVRNVNFASISSGYQIAPVVSDRFVGRYAVSSTRYGFRTVDVARLRGVRTERIHFNRSIAAERGHFRGKDVRARVQGLGKGKFSEHSTIEHARFKGKSHTKFKSHSKFDHTSHVKFKEKSHTKFKGKSHVKFQEKSHVKFSEKVHRSGSSKFKAKSQRSESFKAKHAFSGGHGGGRSHFKLQEKSMMRSKHQASSRGGFEGGRGGKSHFKSASFHGGKRDFRGGNGGHKSKCGGKVQGYGNGKR